MRPVSSRFLRTLSGSHEMCVRVRVVSGSPVGTDPDGVEIEVNAGTVKLDANADVRGQVDLVTSPTRWPSGPRDTVTPYGPELYVERGIVYADGQREWVSQGYFRIDKVRQANAPLGPVALSGSDRMAGIRDARLVAPIVFNAGTSVELVFETLVLEVYPAAEIMFDFDATSAQFTVQHVCEQDRYGFLRDLARSYGRTMYWDYAGRLQVKAPPDPTDAVWTVASGAKGVLVDLDRTLDRAAVYNAVVVTGEAPGDGDPVRSVSRDLNPESPTYWFGPFGKVPRFFSSTFITETSQADSASSNMLRRVIGLPYKVDCAAVPNPALEPLDPVRVTTDDRTGVHVVETMSLSLTVAEAMTATTREQTDLVIDTGVG